MKKTDIGVVVFMYAVCAFFYAYSYKLTEESKTYPMFTIALLFALTTLYLVQMIINARKFGVESGADEVFAGFKPVQFIVSIVLTLVYGDKRRNYMYLKVHIVPAFISVLVMNLLIYFAFVKFLGVKLPSGLLF